MRPWVLGVGCWVLAFGAAAAPSADDVAAKIRAGQDALVDWRLDEAAAIARELDAALPDVPPVQALVGAVKFHQGDYEGAVKLLERASEGGDPPPLLALARSTRDETKGFVAQESEHFVVRTPPGKDEILAPIALWALEQAYARVTVAFDWKPNHKIPVDVLHDPKGLASVSTLTEKEILTSGTIALCKYNRLMITSPKALARGYSWLDTLAHEFVHLVVSEKSRNNVPVWMHEGLAKYSETLWRGQAGLALDPASENLLAKGVKTGKLITFEQMHPSMAKLPSQEDTALAFAEVFTVVEMLEKEKPGRLNVVIDALAQGATMDQALVKGTGSDLKGLQKEWRAYLKKRPFRLVPGAEPAKLTFVADARRGTQGHEEQEDEAALDEAKTKAGRRHVRLGNLLRERARARAATVEYEKALVHVGSASPSLSNRLAGLYLELGELERAEKVLSTTEKVHPDDPQTHVLLGRLAMRREDWQAARTRYERATWEAPFNPEIHVALAVVGDKTGDAALKKQAERALALLSGHAAKNAAGDVATNLREGAPFGTVSVTSEPWGRLLVDGRDTGMTTPALDVRLPPGKHRLRVVDDVGGKQAAVEVDVVEGKQQRAALTLRVPTADERRAWIAAEDALAKPVLQKPAAPPAVDAGDLRSLEEEEMFPFEDRIELTPDPE